MASHTASRETNRCRGGGSVLSAAHMAGGDAASAVGRGAAPDNRRAAAASSTSGASTSAAGAAPSELFEPAVMALFDKYKKATWALWDAYGGGDEATGGVDARSFVALFCDFDIAPTFLTRRELKAVFAATAAAHRGDVDATAADGSATADAPVLSYAAFVEALGRTALAALSKPAFQHLYPSARDKVSVLLEMWGLGDPAKHAEVSRRPLPVRKGGARK